MQNKGTRTATGIDWAFAPDWLTEEEASFLSGHNRGALRSIIAEGGVDLDARGLIEKQSLHDFQECLALVLHWED